MPHKRDEPATESRRFFAHEILQAALENARRELERSVSKLALAGIAGGITMGLTGLGVASMRSLLGGGGWGYLLAFFALVWVANQYVSIYNRLRLDIKHEQVEIKAGEKEVESARPLKHRLESQEDLQPEIRLRWCRVAVRESPPQVWFPD